MRSRGSNVTGDAVPAGLVATGVFGAIHAGFSIYWSIGGTWLLSSLGSDDVLIHHGVTLGGHSWKRVKRHPTVGNNVTIGAGARILGPVYIGDRVRIGANSVVVQDILAGAVATGVPATIRFPNNGEDPSDVQGPRPRNLSIRG